MSYKIFTRNWWREEYNGDIVPDPGARKTTVMHVDTEDKARHYCRTHNADIPKNWVKLGRKYEYTDGG